MKTLRFIHRWLGIALALPLVVMGLSGVLLTLEPVWPDWGGARVSGGPPASLNAVLAAARPPEGMRASRYVAPDGPGDAARVYFAPADAPRGPGMVQRLDPATAAPLGPPEPTGGVMEWVKQLHHNLLLPEYGGRQVAGWFGVGLLLLTVLGLPLWWPAPGRWREGFTVPRKAKGVRLHRALHGAVGIWLVVMLLATSATGIVQGFPQTARALLGLQSGGPPRPGRAPRDAQPQVPDLDAAVRLATGAMPGLVPRAIMLPATPADGVRLMMVPPGKEGAVVTRIVTIDTAGTRVVSAQPEPSPADKVMRWAHDLHEGQGLGPVWRGLTVLVGAGLPLFAATGVSMWWLKRRNRRRVDEMREAAMQAGE